MLHGFNPADRIPYDDHIQYTHPKLVATIDSVYFPDVHALAARMVSMAPATATYCGITLASTEESTVPEIVEHYHRMREIAIHAQRKT